MAIAIIKPGLNETGRSSSSHGGSKTSGAKAYNDHFLMSRPREHEEIGPSHVMTVKPNGTCDCNGYCFIFLQRMIIQSTSDLTHVRMRATASLTHDFRATLFDEIP